MKKFSKKFFKKRFLNSVTVPKNVKGGGTLCDFLTSIVLQNTETNEGGHFGAIQKVSKSLILPKKSRAMWGFLVFSRFWTSVLFFFRFGRASEVRLELLRFEVDEV